MITITILQWLQSSSGGINMLKSSPKELRTPPPDLDKASVSDNRSELVRENTPADRDDVCTSMHCLGELSEFIVGSRGGGGG